MAAGPVVGTAGWSIPGSEAASFPPEGSALERYAARLGGVEINSSFHRPHRPSTWQRWAESVPDDFRFAVKLPRTISHERRLVDCGDLLDTFLGEAGALGNKLAILLLQLPPQLTFDAVLVEDFLRDLLPRTDARIACEPRHASWFDDEVDALLEGLGVARVAADPAVVPAATRPGGGSGLRYWRLHGSPVMYRSAYGAERLAGYAKVIAEESGAGSDVWCMFDNTASSAAMGDALALLDILDHVSA